MKGKQRHKKDKETEEVQLAKNIDVKVETKIYRYKWSLIVTNSY